MLQIRNSMFETNSSSACVFFVTVYSPSSIHIPKTCKFDSTGDSNRDKFFQHIARRWNEDFPEVENFYAFLQHIGVETIIVDGREVKADEGKLVIPNDKEQVIARCFADDFASFSEYTCWVSGWEEDVPMFYNLDRYRVQQKAKDPNYVVKVFDGQTGEEIDWEDCSLSKEVFSEEQVQTWINDEKKFERWERIKEQKAKEWEKFRLDYIKKYGVDPDTFDDIHREVEYYLEPISDDEEYYERLTEEMIKASRRPRKNRYNK